MLKRTLILGLVLTVVACSKSETPAPAATSSSASSPAAATTSSSQTTNATVTPLNRENLLSLGSGAIPVTLGGAPEQGASAYYMFDDDPTTGWASNDGQYNTPTVVEMEDRAIIRQVSFDEAKIAYDGRIPKRVLVEVSDTNATTGFKPIADVTMSEMKDGQTFPVSAEVPGRYVRVTVKEAVSDAAIAQIMEFRAFGERLTHNPIPDVTGDYEMTDTTHFHLRQQGSTVSGCYDNGTEPLNGGMEGRILKFKYAVGENGSGPALLVFSDDGRMFGGWWRTDGASEHPTLSPLEGKRASKDPGNTACPQWKATPEQTLAAELKKTGRVRLYGINFDSDSDVLRSESKPTLDRVATVLKENASWTMTIEGHTDATATPEHNQDLSTRRANAVKQYLTTAGIDAARLTATGLGSSQPAATNDTALGRAANRRVEIVKTGG
ncbi:MAG TPA: OmpA family protein [Thermoanaerobaculia bacterium]|nr:OmpA family protein [Thermoanaerobaculia bacterium]